MAAVLRSDVSVRGAARARRGQAARLRVSQGWSAAARDYGLRFVDRSICPPRTYKRDDLRGTPAAFLRRGGNSARPRARAFADRSVFATSRVFDEDWTDGLITADVAAQSEEVRDWLAEVYDRVDYVDVLTRAETAEKSATFDETADEFIYGEFDMSFFIGLMQRFAELAQSGDGTFADLGSGRGQLVHLAALTGQWKQCIGVEIVPVLHEMACAANKLIVEEKGAALRPCTFACEDFKKNMALFAEVDLAFVYATMMPVDDASGALLISRDLRAALPAGAAVVTINRPLEEAAGFALQETLVGPNPETPLEPSTAFVYRAVS